MSQRAYLHPRLSSSKLREQYRNCKNLPESRRWHLLWLLSLGKTLVAAAFLVGLSERYARSILSRYNQLGIPALRARPHDSSHPRRPPLLSPALRSELGRLLKHKAPDGGLWTGPRVATWMAQKLGRKIHPQRGWDYLKRLGYSPQRPRPEHADTSALVRDRFKKNSSERSKRGEARSQKSGSSSGRTINTESGSSRS
jgi:transposase